MSPAWAQRQEELLCDCIVSPDVFDSMVDRLCDFVVPYQHALETEAGRRNVHLYLQGLLSHVPHKNVEDIATLVDSSAWSYKSSSAPPPGIIARWCACWWGTWSSGWGNPMASLPLTPVVSPSGARTRWG